MKKFLLGTVGLLALGMAAPASAADMAVKARPPAPVLAPIYDWTGFYIGGNGGWGQSNSCLNFVDAFGFDFADGCALAVRRSRRRPDRLPLAGQPMGVWPGSTGRLGGSQPHARQPVSIDPPASPLAPKPMASASLPARSATPGIKRCST